MGRLEWICAAAVVAVALAIIAFLAVLALDRPCVPCESEYEQGGTR